MTEAGLRTNVNVGILYLESWLRGVGAAAIYNLMEDAATAEISRSQVWQWIRHGRFTKDEVERVVDEEIGKIRGWSAPRPTTAGGSPRPGSSSSRSRSPTTSPSS